MISCLRLRMSCVWRQKIRNRCQSVLDSAAVWARIRGEGPLNEYINSIAAFSQNAVSVPAGNEGTARHHYMKTLSAANIKDTIELRVGEKESTRGFMLEFWGDSPNFYSMTIQSPTGEQLSISTSLKNSTQELYFVFVETKVLVNYVPIERRTGNTLIFIRFLHPAVGIWKFLVGERIPGKADFTCGFQYVE